MEATLFVYAPFFVCVSSQGVWWICSSQTTRFY